ncbi:hypothetical protein Y032_0089g2273 [Ancylostoma ceylanicum]|uniref:Reverse transcriptase domain-containing protein n=1 Tax=Ancylostoma ceylanicum TaxID=53326 RepID=A0A016TNA9_9BILA|nr:hypothetical protein Y032_0089g2273 [Ancylostoma ceylanicum]
MRKAIKSGEAGVSWNNHGRLTDLDYADDIALLAESDSKLQEATSSLNQEATKVGLRISAEKSKVMKIGIEHTPININVGTTQLENFTNFTYLGSTVSYDGDADSDIRTRITKAAAVFRRLQPRGGPFIRKVINEIPSNLARTLLRTANFPFTYSIILTILNTQ